MAVFRTLLRLAVIVAGAVVGLALFLLAALAFVVFAVVRLLTGRKPDLTFRVNRNPWASRSQPAGDVVDVEAREVAEPGVASAPTPATRTAALPLRGPEQG
ncbi:hypothetical protein [Roseateles sp. BYS87W]|uniref:Uncharacterized protein n=1 Tax=Pelomonas baiyunensis TaxID=3299026 RepID=A0ABW7GW14_9BURK